MTVQNSSRLLTAAFSFVLTACLSFSSPAAAADGELKADAPARWLWFGEMGDGSKAFLRRTFTFAGEVKSAQLVATADNHCKVFLNGEQVLTSKEWSELPTADLAKKLKPGRNVLAIEATNQGGQAGAFALLRVVTSDGKTLSLATDKDWKASTGSAEQWERLEFDDSQWKAPIVVGALGAGKLPWSEAVNVASVETALGGPNQSSDFLPQIAENVTPREGFQVEKLFQVPKSMGSWVSLTTDPKGRLIASDQGGAGLFLITPGDEKTPTKVEKLPVKLSGAQGLCWAFDALYAVVNGGQTGLHRLTDTNNDGLVDQDEFLMPIPGGGEHGPHAVILSPDGKSLYVCAGNHTKLPDAIKGSRVPQNWSEDHLLPRRWDANGHATGILAPGGWICKVDPAGKSWEVISMGYRNQYDIAFNADDELFSYDSDMEWDLGSAWYRPTRVCHATSGSEFGWRSGTGVWPAYYEDSLPPVVDIGPGSPVGVVFGYGAKFPAKYQNAMFILDWTYSTMYAVHLKPDGASYKAEKEDFVFGSPMPVTDAVVGSDGALYYTVGGRGAQSALYRVKYVGSESTAPAVAKSTAGTELRKLRHELEAYHGRTDGDLDKIFANLGHADRFVRYAARIALESQPLDAWRERALTVKEPKASILAMMALARQGKPADQESLLTALDRLDFKSLSKEEQLALLRTYELTFVRLGEPSDSWRQKMLGKLDPLFPAAYLEANNELVQLLVYLRSPTIVKKTQDLMDNLGPEPIPDWGELAKRNANYGGTVARMLENIGPVRALHYQFVLRNVKEPWTIEQRRKYFEFFLKAAKHPGGSSYPGFLAQIREEALANVPPAERIVLDDVAGRSLVASFESTPPQGPGKKWTKEEVLAALGSELRGCNFEQGRNLYHATLCAKCHRFNAEGGAIGPDLSTAGRKFSLPDLVDALVDPSKAISDQYGSQQVLTTDGDSLIGRVVEVGDNVYVYTADATAAPKIFPKAKIEEMRPSKVSQMPEGLLNALNEQEVRNLVGYLLSAGDRKHAVFKAK